MTFQNDKMPMLIEIRAFQLRNYMLLKSTLWAERMPNSQLLHLPRYNYRNVEIAQPIEGIRQKHGKHKLSSLSNSNMTFIVLSHNPSSESSTPRS
jgi:hypothetical protein